MISCFFIKRILKHFCNSQAKECLFALSVFKRKYKHFHLQKGTILNKEIFLVQYSSNFNLY